MKDHELRELVNAVTKVARTYAGTQQLREQISHLIVPAIEKLKCEHAFLSGFKMGAELRIEKLNKELTVLRQQQGLRNNE